MGVTQDILKAIERTIYDAYRCPVLRDTIVLEEAASDAKCKKVSFANAKAVLVYKFDQVVLDDQGKKIKEPFPFLAKENPIRSKCDFLIFHARENADGKEKLYVFVCNMKSELPGNAIRQFEAGFVLSEFLLQTAIRCLNSWSSNQSGRQQLDYKALIKENLLEWRPISIAMKKFPVLKGGNKPHPQMKTKHIDCNESYNFMTLLT
jgi:hypothetical protein